MHPWRHRGGSARHSRKARSTKKNEKLFCNLTQLVSLSFFCFLEWHWWNQKFGCLQHAWHTPVPLHNSQSAMALLHGYPLGLFDHPSGPARYVISRRLVQRLTRTGSENGLRVRTKPSNAGSVQNKKNFVEHNFFLFLLFLFSEDRRGRSKKLCRPPILGGSR